MPLGVIPGQVKEWASMVREVFDKPAVEVGEAKKRLHLLLVCRCGPFCNSSDFDRVHGNRVMGDDHAKVLYCGFLKLTLVWPKVEFVSL